MINLNDYIKKYTRNKECDIQDVYTIVSYVLNISRNEFLIQKNEIILEDKQEQKITELLDKYYINNYPLQYITHKQFFYNEEYYVDENVLIPRADTEVLVEKAIEYINKENIKNIIDLCTGSGAIGISIAKNSNVDKVTLIDISAGAIDVARKNTIKNGVEDKIEVLESDLLKKVDYKVEMIVSNPPYAKTKDMDKLDENVKYEPHIAIDGGEDGMDFYIRIITEAKKVLNKNGLLIFEIGYDELEQMKNLINEHKEYELLECIKDYGGNDRVVICRFQDK